MAQKPVANALILELEPVVGENIDRHLGTEKLWFAHDFVPFEQGENFALLGGRDWDPSQVTLPKVITDACEILLVTKDNVAGYHRELVEHFILEDNWAQWLGRWTAEEHLHAIALREYFVVTREIDPTANEQVRFEHVSSKGYRADQFSQVETLVFMAPFTPTTWRPGSRSRCWPDSSPTLLATKRGTRSSSPTSSRTASSTPATRRSLPSPPVRLSSTSSAPTSTPTTTRCKPSLKQAFSARTNCEP
jgi:hypothetical protein